MPETAPMLRGYFYNTHMYQRCPDFHQCRRCTLCRNFNRHSAQCQTCESRKPAEAPEHHCRCTIAQEGALIQLETRIKRLAHDPNAKPGEVSLARTGLNPELQRLVEVVAPSAQENGHR